MNKIKLGWAHVDFTPSKKIKLSGQFYERVSTHVESAIGATSFAIDSGDDQMIICSCDLSSIANNLNLLVKEKLKDLLPISPDKVIINAIHTHTSYVYTAKNFITNNSSLQILNDVVGDKLNYVPLVSEDSAMNPDEALNILVDKISQSILLAWENRQEGYYQNAFGRVAVGMNRRVCYDDGSAKMWGDTNSANFTHLEGGNDSGMELIYTFDKNKNLTGVISNIACPAQVVEHRSFISSDYWGKVKENLKNKFGRDIFVLGLCSPAGDQCPRDMVRWVNGETPIDDPNISRPDYIERRADPSMFDISGLKLVGKRITNEIMSVYEELHDDYKDSGLLVHETLTLNLPLRRVTISDYQNAVDKIEEFIKKNENKTISYNDTASLHVYAGTIARTELQHSRDTVPIEMHVIRFGDIAIATNPFELFLDYGNQIRARSRAKQTFLIQLACGSLGYLPTEKAENGGHYSAYVSSGYVGHEGGNVLVRETIERINKKF
jgi:hypothetical protein